MFQQIILCSCIRFIRKVGQFHPVHQRIKPHRARLVPIRQNKRRKLLFHNLRVFIADGLIAFHVCIQIDILQMLFYRKIFPIQLLHLTTHSLNQLFPINSQALYLTVGILQFIGKLKFQIKNRTL